MDGTLTDRRPAEAVAAAETVAVAPLQAARQSVEAAVEAESVAVAVELRAAVAAAAAAHASYGEYMA